MKCLTPECIEELRRGEEPSGVDVDAALEHLARCRRCGRAFAGVADAPADAPQLAHAPELLDSVDRLPSSDFEESPDTAPAASLETHRMARDSRESEEPGAFVPWPPPSPLDDLPDWKIIDILGVGGMGAVYLAVDRPTGEQRRALKVIQRGFHRGPEFARRFQREIEILRNLPPHKNLVVGENHASYESFDILFLEHIRGQNLEEFASAFPSERVPYRRAVGLILQALIGLDWIWRQMQLVHRDLKPTNLMLTTDGVVKILDLGLAKARLESCPNWETQSEIRGGTWDYCSPEQIRNFRDVDIRSDLYSLGCTLYRLISGHPPFALHRNQGNQDSVQLAHLERAPRPLHELVPDVPVALSRVVGAMLEKQPRRRPPDPVHAAEALHAFADDDARLQLLRTWPRFAEHLETRRAQRVRRSGRFRGAAVALLSLALLAAAVVFVVRTKAGRLEIAVDDPRTEIWIDDSPVDRTRVGVRSTGEKKWWVIEAVAGEHEVRVRRPGFVATASKVRVEAGRATPLEVRLVPDTLLAQPKPLPAREPGGEEPPRPAEEPAPRPAVVDRRATILWGSGRWTVDEGELRHHDGEGHAEQWILFGDPAWVDYDFRFDVRHEGRITTGVTALFRSPDDEHIQTFGFGWINHDLAVVEFRDPKSFWNRLAHPGGELYRRQLDWKIENDRWYQVLVSVRGERTDCIVDGKKIFEVVNNPFPRGRVGFRTWRKWSGRTQFRDITVRAPDGRILWEGPPELPGPNPRELVISPEMRP